MINLKLFQALHNRIQSSAVAYIMSQEPKQFLEVQETLKNAIERHSWPDDWNIEWEEFIEYYQSSAGVKTYGTESEADSEAESEADSEAQSESESEAESEGQSESKSERSKEDNLLE